MFKNEKGVYTCRHMYNNTLNAVREGAFEKCRKLFLGKGYDGKERIYVCSFVHTEVDSKYRP
jgi:hypothetical protein